MNLDERLDRIIKAELQPSGPTCNWCWLCSDCQTTFVEGLVEEGAARIGASGVQNIGAELGKFIDHTLLKADAAREQIEKLCQEARQYRFASVCINPTWVSLCSDLLRGSGVVVCTVVGFPLGATVPEGKAAETRASVAAGAEEIDMVINIGRLKSGEYDAVCDDIAGVVQAAGSAKVKVIIETCYLTDEEKVRACVLSMEAGAAFVKTSTGFGPAGATLADVALMRRVVGPTLGVKAAGGVKNAKDAEQMITAGATRLGASAGIAIVSGESATTSGY